jgi:DNA repair protein SbcD/Mre11
MRLLHTSDWHLGHSLHGVGREREHAAFLAWLVDTIEREQIEAVLVTGDIFDGSTPPAAAEAMWYGFLAAARTRVPGLQIVVIAGNHDSPARLSAPAPLLEALGVRVVASVGRDPDDLIIDLGGAVVAAVPFLRPMDLPDLRDGADAIEAVQAVYAGALEAARARRAGRPMIVTGHLFIAGGAPSWVSERRVITGGQEAVQVDLFADDVAYVALGHLHRAQRIGGREHVRYAGSPIPLAMVEAEYRHQVAIVDAVGTGPAAVRTIEVPRTIELLRVPRHGAAPLDDVLAVLAALPDAGDDLDARPFLEVVVALDQPEPRLRDRVEAAVAGRAVRLVKITAQGTGDRAALGDIVPGKALADLDPRDVLARRWSRDHEAALPDAVARAFDELLEAARGGAAR